VNPVVLIEILSDATREYDRTQKFDLCKEIPSLREYILVEQSAVLVEVFCAPTDDGRPSGWTTSTRR
jgi:Uma2 family endonuclease